MAGGSRPPATRTWLSSAETPHLEWAGEEADDAEATRPTHQVMASCEFQPAERSARPGTLATSPAGIIPDPLPDLVAPDRRDGDAGYVPRSRPRKRAACRDDRSSLLPLRCQPSP